MNKLKGSRRFLWLGGIALLVFGVLAAMLILPLVSPTPGVGGPAIRVPKMQNIPPEGAPLHVDPNDQR